MILSTDSKYPSRRAYVVKFAQRFDPGRPDWASGKPRHRQRCEFTSAHELLRLIVRDIDGCRPSDAGREST
jgi:hypothetical protein